MIKTQTLPGIARPAQTATGRIGLADRLLGRFNLWRQRQHLAALDTHLLKDVGLRESDVLRERQRPHWSLDSSLPRHWLR
jgi:uncharacterized protein YjiS (DUF1127 family)